MIYTTAGGWGEELAISDVGSYINASSPSRAGAASIGGDNFAVVWASANPVAGNDINARILSGGIFQAIDEDVGYSSCPDVSGVKVRGNSNGQAAASFAPGCGDAFSKIVALNAGEWSSPLIYNTDDFTVTQDGHLVSVYGSVAGVFSDIYTFGDVIMSPDSVPIWEPIGGINNLQDISIVSDSGSVATAAWAVANPAGTPWESGGMDFDTITSFAASRLPVAWNAPVWDAPVAISHGILQSGVEHITQPIMLLGSNDDVHVLATGGIVDSMNTRMYIARYSGLSGWHNMSIGGFASGYQTYADISYVDNEGTDVIIEMRGEIFPFQYAKTCGDGFLDLTGGEQCDDHNMDNGDGCGATCQIE